MEPQKMVTSDTCGIVAKLKVVGEDGVAADVGQHRQRAGGDHGAADGQAVQTVGQVHRVAGADNHQAHEGDEGQERQRREVAMMQAADDQVRAEVLEERHDQAGGVQPVRLQGAQDRRRWRWPPGTDRTSLARAGQAQVAAVHHLQIVVGKADGAEGQRGEHRDPDEPVAQVGPQQRGNQHADDNQHAAHGGRAGLFLMGLGTFLADVLADLEFAQAADHGRAR